MIVFHQKDYKYYISLMLNTFFNKTAHPILNRYHHNRMTQGTDIIKEMDTMINKISTNQTIDSV